MTVIENMDAWRPTELALIIIVGGLAIEGLIEAMRKKL